MRGCVDVPVLREMAGSRVGVTEGLGEGGLVVGHSAPGSDTRDPIYPISTGRWKKHAARLKPRFAEEL
jgi:hypothetical protein